MTDEPKIKSKIFTDTEFKMLKNAFSNKKGWRKDPTGIYNKRIKPKLIEILNWFKKKSKIEDLLKINKQKGD